MTIAGTGSVVSNVDDSTFAREVLQAAGTVLVEVGAAWCPPCRVLEPHVESVANEYRSRMKVVALDADDSPQTAAGLRVRGLPTVVIIKDGVEVARQVGAVSRAKLVALFEAHL